MYFIAAKNINEEYEKRTAEKKEENKKENGINGNDFFSFYNLKFSENVLNNENE